MDSREVPSLIAEVYAAATALRQSGQAIANAEGARFSHWLLLDALTDPYMTVARAARRMGLSRQAVQKTANELDELGCIEFVENPDHKTSPLIHVTDIGVELRERLHRRAETSNDRYFGALTPDQVATARTTLQSMTRAIYDGNSD
jgi:DNA-binding MarR family transcriptional regulator